MKFVAKKPRPNSFFAQPAAGPGLAIVAMVVAVTLANVLAQYPLGPWLTWGTPVIASTFLINELSHQLYGTKTAKLVVLRGFWAALVASLVFAPTRIALASAAAFLSSQLLDISVFRRLRLVRGKYWWLAPAFASAAASIIDTGLFFLLAFWGAHQSWWRLALGDLAVKVAFDVVMLVPFRLLMRVRCDRQQLWTQST